VPEGDSIHRAAARVRVLEGDVISAESHHPRAVALGIAEQVDGRRLERVEAVGKNLLLTFEGDLVLRSHLRIKGRWRVQSAGGKIFGNAWLVLRGREHEAILWNGSVLELTKVPSRGRERRLRRDLPRTVRRLGPDIMLDPPDLEGMVARFRAADQRREVGESLLDQRLVAGIGNKWKAEGLWLAELSPWVRLENVTDGDLRTVLAATSREMRSGRRRLRAYRRAGRPCPRCGGQIRSWPQGDDARPAYWCTGCQRDPGGGNEPCAQTVEGGTGRTSA
jgi:endonuclease VIII